MSTGDSIVFLHNNKFDFYSPATGRVVEFRFVQELIRDMEIINAELLENLIRLFVNNNKAIPGGLIIVLSDNTGFVKDFTGTTSLNSHNQPNQSQATQKKDDDTGKIDEKINDFIENVPFENVAYKKFPIVNGFKVFATNKDFFTSIKNAFEKAGFRVGAIYPGIVFGNNISTKQILDIVAVNIIIQQADAQKVNNFLIEEKKATTQVPQETKERVNQDYTVPDQEPQEKPKTNKNRMIVMLSIFGVLIIVLIYMVINATS